MHFELLVKMLKELISRELMNAMVFVNEGECDRRRGELCELLHVEGWEGIHPTADSAKLGRLRHD